MARRGQCRCGLVLRFHRTPQGYKMRCPSCGAVVRLRVDRKPRKAARADEINVDLVALAELDARSRSAPLPARRPAPRPAPSRRGRTLMVVAGVVLFLLSVAGGAVWWFSQ